ncbi:MAG: signal peptide peptidase SppA [Spirochaetota bacterium]|nr:signal peptide peptidase SppA [Spirochaetota bacterium]
MDKNRKIILSILTLVALSSILAIIDIGLNMDKTKQELFTISTPETGPGVGIIRIYGPIRLANDRGHLLGMDSGADSIVKRLDDFGKDNNIKAIVVRINSPGGTVGATQEIYQKLIKLKQKNIILIASIGDVAASGGYYIASACNHILANYGSITGSIGVIAVSPNLKELFHKIGIKMNVIKSGKYKDLLSLYRDISEEEKDIIQRMIDSSYNRFLKDVSLGRNMPISDIKPFADGRVMDGERAVKHNLVDSIGNLEDAINKAREMAKLPQDSAVYDEVRTPLERIIMSIEKKFTRDINLQDRIINNEYSLLEYRYVP